MNIFVGSSGNGLKIAKAIKQNLVQNLDASVHCWNDSFFEPEEGTLDNLFRKVIFYDFAIFVATKDDDLTQKRIQDDNTVAKKKCQTIRDNVVFEYGLFSGALGKKRVFLIVEEGSDLPTDFCGVTNIQIKTKLDKNNKKTLANPKPCYEKLRQAILEELLVSRIHLLPSTTTALSYYDNFIAVICKAILNGEKIYVDNQEILLNSEKTKIHVVLPNCLEPDLKPRAQRYYARLKAMEAKIKRPQKDFSFKVKYDGEHMDIYDIPVILSSSYRAVLLYTGTDYIGLKSEVSMCLHREIESFENTLVHLLQIDDSFSEYVVLEKEKKLEN